MKKAKKILCLALTLIIVLSLTVTASAKETRQTCPMITIPGFTSSNVYDDITDESTLVGFPSTDDIIDIVKEAFIPALLVYAVDRDTDKLVVSVTDRVNEVFAYWFNESTGEAKEGSGIIPQKLTSVTSESRLTFSYDWRGDPVKIADELNEYIETVCELSGCEKVAIGSHSLGTTIALAYITKYGNDRVKGIVFDSPACNGVAIIGNILTGKLYFDNETLGLFLKNILGESEYSKLISSLIDIFDTAGVLELVIRFADEIVEALAPAVYRETVAPLLGCWPTLWSMVPDEKIDECKAYIFDEILKDKDTSVLEAKIDTYNNTVRANRDETLQAFNAVGNFAVFSRYTQHTVPLTGSSKLIGDTIIDTVSSSFGATTAPVGEYFSDSYLKDKDMKYISPDRTVDASTCLFPEQTWFIKDSGHFETDGLTTEYYDMFLFAEKELTCDTAEIGRFTYRSESFTLTEDTSVPVKAEKPSILKSIYNLGLSLIELIKNLIKNGI